MTPGHVAYGMWAAYGTRTSPATVDAWEHGVGAPDETELTALAGALWCSSADLLSCPSTLREFRLTKGLALPDAALAAGMEQAVYEQVEETGEWTGNDRQADALAAALQLPLEAVLSLTGKADELAELLRNAVTGRWQPYVRQVGKLVPLPRAELSPVLRDLHGAYQSATAGSLAWSAAEAPEEAAATGRDFLDDILRHFWQRTRSASGTA
jgi:hypothetical protein